MGIDFVLGPIQTTRPPYPRSGFMKALISPLSLLLPPHAFEKKCEGDHESWTDCVATYAFNGGIYMGGFRNGRFHGQGEAAWEDGVRYLGEWENDSRGISLSSHHSVVPIDRRTVDGAGSPFCLGYI